MEKAENTHWRKILKTPYLNGEEIPKEGVSVVIKGFSQVEMYSQKEKEKEGHAVLELEGIAKPMVLTNRKAKQISKVLGTPLMAEWIGKSIHIFPVNEKHFGETFPVINVKTSVAPKPKEKLVLNEKSANWGAAVESLKSGAITVEQIKKSYTLELITEKKMLTLQKAK